MPVIDLGNGTYHLWCDALGQPSPEVERLRAENEKHRQAMWQAIGQITKARHLAEKVRAKAKQVGDPGMQGFAEAILEALE